MDVPVLLMWWYIMKETLFTKNVVSSKFQMAPFCECNKGRFPNFPPHLQRSVHAHPQLCTTVHGMREGGGWRGQDTGSHLGVVSSLGRYVFGSEISYNKAPPRLPGLGC